MSAHAHYYHCATKGFDHSVMFADDAEFIAGMNRIGICTVRLQEEAPVNVIAFCLMDNHIHVILHGLKEACLQWMGLYHKLTMMWKKNRTARGLIDECWEYDAWLISDAEDLKQKIAYVFRNPTAAGMGIVPGGYRWSSASLVFSNNAGPLYGAKRVGSMSIYKSRNLFGTRLTLPPDWMVLPDGVIWPGCYTTTSLVEKVFENPRRFLYYLNQNLEADINLEMYGKKLSLPDKDIAKVASTVAAERFGTEDLHALDLHRRIHLCKLVRKKTGATVKQLARILHVPLDELKMLFG